MAMDTTCSGHDVVSLSDDDNNNIDDVGSETEERELKRQNTHCITPAATGSDLKNNMQCDLVYYRLRRSLNHKVRS